ncbi:hypothetical protein EST38_g3729 [Candolleomyces aberdarensis]|uniref:Uncharacterized protein n=1 Tax=Candolleomyces aberdarensis TaxID=2316362 RepID=A0A4Q2DTC3_9AGAR|nr:hypothetical protein EST38_g3729 [Candolleomyces aberdarensis]
MSAPNDTPLSFMAGAHSLKIPNLTVNAGNDNRKDYRTTNAEFMIHNSNQYTGGARHYNPMTFGGNSKGATTSHHADPFVQWGPGAVEDTFAYHQTTNRRYQ